MSFTTAVLVVVLLPLFLPFTGRMAGISFRKGQEEEGEDAQQDAAARGSQDPELLHRLCIDVLSGRAALPPLHFGSQAYVY